MAARFPRVSQFGNYWAMSSLLLGCSVALVTTVVYFAWAAQPLRSLKLVEVVGQPDNSVFVDGKPAKTGVPIAIGQQISTLQNARVGLQQAGLQQAEQVLARLGGQSSATVQPDCLQLGAGQLVAGGAPGCIGAAIVTGSDGVYALERLGTLGEIKVLSGRVTVAVPSNSTVGAIALTANQKITLSLTGDDVGPVRLMLPSEVNELMTGELFQGFQRAIANQNTLVGFQPPSPQPTASPTAKSTPAKPLQAKPAADKVPAPVAAHPRPVTFSQPDSETDSYTENDRSSTLNAYPRYVRRRRPIAPNYDASDDDYTYRRRWTRSPSAGAYYRRRVPSYSAPDHEAPARSAPSYHPPAPVEAPINNTPAPVEAPPVAPPPTLEPAPLPSGEPAVVVPEVR